MTTSEQNKTATFTMKNFVAFLIATVFLGGLFGELLAKDFHTGSMWMLAAIVAAVSLAAASTFSRRRRSRMPNQEL